MIGPELLGATAAAGAALGAYAYVVEPRRFRLGHITLRPARRPPRPFRVLQISDCHFMARQPWKERFFTSLAAQPVDFALLLGDLIDDNGGIEPLLRCIARLRPRYGTYAVLGVHDFVPHGAGIVNRVLAPNGRFKYRNDGKMLVRRLGEMGVHFFRNSGFVLEPGPASPFEAPVYICGINDAKPGWDDVARAMRHRPTGMFALLLSHALHEFEDIISAEPDLCFAGHSHGGAVRVPFHGALVTRSTLPTRYARDAFRMGRTVFHLNHGMGSGRFSHLRFNCRPEATVIDVV